MTVEQREHPMLEAVMTPPRALGELAMTPLGLHGPFFNHETRQEVPFPPYRFVIDTSKLIDTPTVTRSNTDRLRYALRTIEETCAADFPSFDGISQPAVRDSQLKARDNYLRGLIKVHGVSKQRLTMVDTGLAFAHIAHDFREARHPAMQLLEQITQATEQLPKAATTELSNNLLTVVAWPQLRAIFDAQIMTYKQQDTG